MSEPIVPRERLDRLRPLDRDGVAYATLALVGLACFARTFDYGLSNHDDTALITNSQPFLLDLRNLFRVFVSDPFTQIAPSAGGIYYRPVLWQSFILDAQLGGADPTIYHASNFAYHLIASALVFRLLTRFDHSRTRSLFFSLAFLLHPSLLQATAWIPGRNDSLLAVFVVATVLSLRDFFTRGSLQSFLSATLFWNLTLYTKEGGLFVAALAPVLLGSHWLRARSLPPRSLPLALVWIVSGVLWFALRRSSLGAFPLFFSQIPDNLEMFVVYIGKAIFPFQLAVVPSTQDSSLVPGVVVLLCVSIGITLSRQRRLDVFALGLLWFFGGLAPALLAPSATRGLEHRLYVPMIGLLLVLAEFRWPARWPRVRFFAPIAAIVVLVSFAAITTARLPDYASPRAYWQSAYRDAPGSIEVQSGLCRVEMIEANWREATRPCEEAVRTRPRDPVLHFLLGWVYLEQDRIEDAERSLRQSVRIDRRYPEAWEKLAQALEAQGRMDEARTARGSARRPSGNP